MSYLRTLRKGLFVSVTAVFSLLSSVHPSFADAAKGKQLFQQNCASCHNVFKQLTGPALKGVEERWGGDRAKLRKWIRNPASMYNGQDAYATKLYNDYNKVPMTPWPSLSDDDINSILDYIKEEADKELAAAKTPAAGGAPGAAGETKQSSDNSLLFGILTLILAVVAVILMQINSNLSKLASEKEGTTLPEPIPFYRNKTYIATIIILLFMLGGYWTINGAIGLGRQKNYMPKQPIFYSHKVHAGINQINCLYCHAGAEKSKQAMIPSPNICMNCHKAINEYAGEPLYTAEGKQVDGTAEIQKLYEYAGWDPQKKQYVNEGKPIEWIKIHNLPDHVYFNHSQHVVAGKVQCQTCHGEIQKMDEVYQFADLSMGWCVNCHRETKVQFTENNYYSIFEKFHEDLKNHKLDSVTVEKVGGTECQKCHY